jgi:hypothetical protein
LYKVSSLFIKDSGLVGFNISIRGKIGATGSVRKKVFYIKLGQYSSSRYYLNGDIYYNSVTTKTGKIGLKMILTYY